VIKIYNYISLKKTLTRSVSWGCYIWEYFFITSLLR